MLKEPREEESGYLEHDFQEAPEAQSGHIRHGACGRLWERWAALLWVCVTPVSTPARVHLKPGGWKDPQLREQKCGGVQLGLPLFQKIFSCLFRSFPCLSCHLFQTSPKSTRETHAASLVAVLHACLLIPGSYLFICPFLSLFCYLQH